MSKENKIKRGWVKKIGVIFIIIMLILTFFSNTIMNISLAQVSVQNINSGEIQTSVSGAGTAKAESVYEVMINDSRKVKDVLVQEGDSVKKGDILFVLENKENNELKSADDNLYDLNLQYQKLLINMPNYNYTMQDRNITRTKEDLETATKEHDENMVSATELENAEASLNVAKDKVSQLTENINTLQEKLNDYAGATDESINSLSRQIEDKKRQIKNSDTRVENPISIDKLKLELSRLKQDYNLLSARYSDYDEVMEQSANNEIELFYARQDYEDAKDRNKSEEILAPLKEKVNLLETVVHELKEKIISYSEYTNLRRRIDDKETEIDDYEPYVDGPSVNIDEMKIELKRLEEDYDVMVEKNKSYVRISNQIKVAKDNLEAEQEKLEEEQEKYDELHNKSEKAELAGNDIKSLQNNLEDQTFNLEQQKKADQISSSLKDLDVKDLLKNINEQKSLIGKLREEQQDVNVIAEKDGIIQSVSIVEGGFTSPNTTMTVIETNDTLYTTSFTVTKEQRELLSINDIAKVDTKDVTAKLSQIKKDDIEDNMILTFLLDGQVKSGEKYSLTIKQKSKKYDLLIPKSALHSDSTGYFVLTVKSKKTASGARYNAQRVGVEVLDKDDQNVAIKSSLNEGDYIITQSSKALKPGMSIRMAND